MLAPIAWRTPPRHYGPWELVTSLLTEALVARGIDVTLFATLDSVTTATLAGVVPAPYSEDPSVDAKVWEYRHLAHVFEQAGAFDIIHNQADFPAHAFSRLTDTPLVTTIHGFSSDRILPMYAPYQDRVHYVAISDADRHPALRYAATIHHGIPIDDFPFDAAGSDDLLFFGRIHPDKGAQEAIAIARAVGRRLAAVRHRSGSAGYYDAGGGCRRTTASPSAYHGVGRWRVAAFGRLGHGACAAASDQLRRAVRAVGDRGDGVRHAGDRGAARGYARTDRAWRHRLPGRRRGAGDRRDRADRRDRSGRGARARRRTLLRRSHGDAYVALYRRILGTP